MHAHHITMQERRRVLNGARATGAGVGTGPVVSGPAPTNPHPTIPSHGAPEGPCRVGTMPLDGGGDDIRWIDIPPCFVFHGLNAHRDGDDVVLRLHRLDQAFGPRGDLRHNHSAGGASTTQIPTTASAIGSSPSSNPRSATRTRAGLATSYSALISWPGSRPRG